MLGRWLGAAAILFLSASQPVLAGDFTIDWAGTHDWPANSTGPVSITITDQYGFQLGATMSIARKNGTAVSGYPDNLSGFGTQTSIWVVWDAASGSSGFGESTNTATLSFTSGGSPFAVDALSFIVSDIDATDNNDASDRCDFITATGNNGNPTLSYVSSATASRSVRIGPATGSGSTGALAANQAQCIYNIGTTASPISNADDFGSVLLTYPSGTSTATVVYDESIENVYGVTSRNAAARGGGMWAATAIVADTSISMTKVASATSFGSAGETITYTYTVTNTGRLPLNSGQNIVISDDKIGEFTCATGALATGASVQCTANYTTSAGDVTAGNVTNNAVAGVGSTGQAFSSRLHSGTQSVSIPYASTMPDFSISKTASKSTVSYAGETIAYTITVDNIGTADLTGVNLTDALTQNGSGLTLTSGPTFVSGDTDSDNVLDMGETWVWSASYSVTQPVLDDGHDIVNTATLSTNEAGTKNASVSTATPGTSFACAGDNWPGNLIAGISGSTDCNNISATGQSGEPAPGNIGTLNSIWYQWTAPVNGSVTFDTCDTSYTNYDTYLGAYTGSSVSSLATVTSNDDGSGCANYSSLMTFDVVAGQTYYVQVDGYNTSTGNFRLKWNMIPDQADLELAKAVDNATPEYGDTVTFTLTLVNNGPDPATSVEVKDLLPSGLTFVSATPAQGSFNSSTGVWSAGTLASGGSTTLQISATVQSYSGITNTAEVTSSGTQDSDSTPGDGTGDDYASVSITPVLRDFSDAPTAGYGGANHSIASGIHLGASVTSDTGDYNSPNATGDVDDGVTMPALVQGGTVNIPVSVAGSGGYLQAWIDWDGNGNFGGTGEQIAVNVQDGGAGDADNAANGTILLAVTVPANAVTTQTFARFRWSTTTGTGSSGTAGAGEVEDYAVTVQPGFDLSASIAISSATPYYGATATLTATVTNEGPIDGTGIAAAIVIPDGYAYVSDTSGGNFDSGTGVWTIGALTAGQAVSFEITVVPVTGTSHDATLEITAADQTDIDSDPATSFGSDDLADSVADDDESTATASPSVSPGTPAGAQTCSGTVASVFDWSTVYSGGTWPGGQMSGSQTVSGIDVDVTVTDSGDALSGTPNGPTPIAAPYYQGGLGSIDASLIFEAKDSVLVSGNSVSTEIVFSQPVTEVRLSVFDIDMNTGGSPFRLEQLTAQGYNGGSPVSALVSAGSSVSVFGSVAVGIADSPPTGGGSGAGTVAIGFNSPVDRIVLDFGVAPGSTRTSGNPGFSIHDIAFCAPAMPGLSVTKVATFGSGPATADGTTDNVAAGTVITYTYTITNTGNQTISAISMSDVHSGLGTDPVPDPDTATLTDNGTTGDSSNTVTGDSHWDALGPGDVLTVTATYTVAQQDVDQLQ